MMISGKGITDTKSSMMSSADVNSQSDMKEVIKVFLIKVANKTTSRYGVTLFLFCSSMWLLTQAFLALHNGCWISNPQILTKIKERTSADCRMSPNSAGILKAEADEVEQNRERIPDALHHLLSQQKGDGAGERAVFNVIVERGVAAAPAESPVNIIEKDAQSEQQKKILNVLEKEREKRSEEKTEGVQKDAEPKNEKTEIPPVHSPLENNVHASTSVKDNEKVDDKVDEKVVKAAGLQKETVPGNGSDTQAIKRNDEIVSRQLGLDRQPTLKPFIPLPPGLGKPALDPVPYTIPTNISKDVVKITKDSWETMGCINRVTILTPGTNSLPNDTKWQQLYQSFRKYRMGYYLLKCPDNVCDIILRTGTSAKTIAGGSAVLVGPGTKKMGKKTRAIMDEVKRLTPDNLLKVYLFSLDNSPMINYYDPSMANFEYHYSMTYHSQSDVPIPYGRYRAGVGVESARNWADGKKGLVAWVEDNCDKTFWPRIEYVRELSKHIAVDMYGTCGNRTCASTHCREELKGYKFYLAFEEAACDEFITLHFWQRALSSGAVPVVYGGKKFAYTKVAPPDSFIHIADFDTPKALASYLHKLSGSDAEYNKFHHWRTLGSVQVSGPGFSLDSLCGMVPQLIHLSPPKRRVMSRGKFYRSCRKGIYVNGFAGSGDLSNWTPWR